MADWYYAKNGQQQGPINSAQLKQLAASGQIGPDDLVFREGSTQWVAASTVAGLFPAGGTTTKPSPAPAPAPAPAPERDPDRGGERRRRDDQDFATDDDAPPRSTSKGRGTFGDFLMFRSFVTPWLIMISFWIAVIGVVIFAGIVGVMGLMAMGNNAMAGLGLMVMAIMVLPLGFIYVRVTHELLIITFRIFDVLTDIRNELEKQRK